MCWNAEALVQAYRRPVLIKSSLQVEVDRQTRDIKSIMANIHQGICMIQEDKTIHPDYSLFLEDIVESVEINGHEFTGMLLPYCSLSADDKSQIESVLESCLGEQEICFTMNQSLLPIELKFTKGETTKHLELEWSPMQKDGVIEKILVTIRDVTTLRELSEKSRVQEQEIQKMIEIIQN